MNSIVVFGLGSGLAGACAFRLFFPFILTGILVRFSAGVVFPSALNWLSSTPVLVLLLAGMVAEFLLGYFPGVGFLHTSVYTMIKVFAGAVLFHAVVGWNPWFGIPVGAVITGFLNFAHLLFAPWFDRQHSFRQLDYPFMESLLSIVLTILAIAAPLLSLVISGFLVYGVIRVGRSVV